MVVAIDMFGQCPVPPSVFASQEARTAVSYYNLPLSLGDKICYAPVFPDIMPGATTTLSSPVRLRWALYVALIVPDSKAYSRASIGLMGAGSRAAPHASLIVSVP